MYASNSHSYTHLILALGIVREPTVWVFITSNILAHMTLAWLHLSGILVRHYSLKCIHLKLSISGLLTLTSIPLTRTRVDTHTLVALSLPYRVHHPRARCVI